ncbi:glycosyltransferase [Candidatus Gracilibacteria bacterium]|nr:glycosyltransferase [Candidatus Gracilibacteria bacterium]
MPNLADKKIAIVCDWIIDWGGAELVLEHLLEIFPHADIVTSVCFSDHSSIKKYKIITSFLQKIPFLNRSHKVALMLRPLVFESLDLSEYDFVISSSSAESKGVITKPDTLHICYCHTPTRYFWSHYHEYLNMMEFGILNPLARFIMPKMIHTLRKWDFCAAQRPDIFIGNSQNTRARIEKYYGREAEVIYPGLDTSKIPFSQEKKDYYFYNGRCIPYKKFDLVVETFNQNKKPLIIATNTDNALHRELKGKSNENITWILTDDIDEINTLHSEAKGFLFPPEEDLGLVPIAAMATGTPVIAYGKGGAKETVVDGKTGIFFDEQTPESLNAAIEVFEAQKWDAKKIRKHAEIFDKSEFQKQFLTLLNK